MEAMRGTRAVQPGALLGHGPALTRRTCSAGAARAPAAAVRSGATAWHRRCRRRPTPTPSPTTSAPTPTPTTCDDSRGARARQAELRRCPTAMERVAPLLTSAAATTCDGLSSNDMCCACGGGYTRGAAPAPTTSAPPSPSRPRPTPRPTTRPTTDVKRDAAATPRRLLRRRARRRARRCSRHRSRCLRRCGADGRFAGQHQDFPALVRPARGAARLRSTGELRAGVRRRRADGERPLVLPGRERPLGLHLLRPGLRRGGELGPVGPRRGRAVDDARLRPRQRRRLPLLGGPEQLRERERRCGRFGRRRLQVLRRFPFGLRDVRRRHLSRRIPCAALAVAVKRRSTPRA